MENYTVNKKEAGKVPALLPRWEFVRAWKRAWEISAENRFVFSFPRFFRPWNTSVSGASGQVKGYGKIRRHRKEVKKEKCNAHNWRPEGNDAFVFWQNTGGFGNGNEISIEETGNRPEEGGRRTEGKPAQADTWEQGIREEGCRPENLVFPVLPVVNHLLPDTGCHDGQEKTESFGVHVLSRRLPSFPSVFPFSREWVSGNRQREQKTAGRERIGMRTMETGEEESENRERWTVDSDRMPEEAAYSLLFGESSLREKQTERRTVEREREVFRYLREGRLKERILKETVLESVAEERAIGGKLPEDIGFPRDGEEGQHRRRAERTTVFSPAIPSPVSVTNHIGNLIGHFEVHTGDLSDDPGVVRDKVLEVLKSAVNDFKMSENE